MIPYPVVKIEILSHTPPWGCIYNVGGKAALRIAVGDEQQLRQLKIGQRYEFRHYSGSFVVPPVDRGEVKNIQVVLEEKSMDTSAAPSHEGGDSDLIPAEKLAGTVDITRDGVKIFYPDDYYHGMPMLEISIVPATSVKPPEGQYIHVPKGLELVCEETNWNFMFGFGEAKAIRVGVGPKQTDVCLQTGATYHTRGLKPEQSFTVPTIPEAMIKRIVLTSEDLRPTASRPKPFELKILTTPIAAEVITLGERPGPKSLERLPGYLNNTDVVLAEGGKSVLVCDLALCAISELVTGTGYTDFMFQKSRAERDDEIATWKTWLKENKDESYDDIMRQTVDEALDKLSKGQDYSLPVLKARLGTDFAYEFRVDFGKESPSAVLAEIQTAWKKVRNDPADTWEESLEDEATRCDEIGGELLQKHVEEAMEKQRLRQERLDKLKAENPELYAFWSKHRELEATGDGRMQILQWLRDHKDECAKTSLADDFAKLLDRYEKAYAAGELK
jgi:hypothetical protein